MNWEQIDWKNISCDDLTDVTLHGNRGVAILALCEAGSDEWKFEKMMCRDFDGMKYLAYQGGQERPIDEHYMRKFDGVILDQDMGLLIFGYHVHGHDSYSQFGNPFAYEADMICGERLLSFYQISHDPKLKCLILQYLSMFSDKPWKMNLLETM
jgi:hypothetical protein